MNFLTNCLTLVNKRNKNNYYILALHLLRQTQNIMSWLLLLLLLHISWSHVPVTTKYAARHFQMCQIDKLSKYAMLFVYLQLILLDRNKFGHTWW